MNLNLLALLLRLQSILPNYIKIWKCINNAGRTVNEAKRKVWILGLVQNVSFSKFHLGMANRSDRMYISTLSLKCKNRILVHWRVRIWHFHICCLSCTHDKDLKRCWHVHVLAPPAAPPFCIMCLLTVSNTEDQPPDITWMSG